MAWAVKWKLPAQQKLVLIMLANRTNADTGRCDPSHKKLATDCGMSADSVKRAITGLESAGLLTIIRRTREGVSLPNHYTLHLGVVGADSTTKQESNQEVETETSPDGDMDADEGGQEQKDLLGARPATGCPHEAIIAAYHKELPNCPEVRGWSKKRQDHLRARWKEEPCRQSVEWWRGLFAWMKESDWLMGKSGSFLVSLPWLIKSEENLLKVIEGTYHNNRKGEQG